MADELVPDLLTIEEATRVLRIGRTAGYEQARQWRETNGAVGIPVMDVGGQFRVPRWKLEERIGRAITHIPEPRRTSRRPETKPAERAGGVRHGGEVRELRPAGRGRPARPDRGGGQGALPL